MTRGLYWALRIVTISLVVTALYTMAFPQSDEVGVRMRWLPGDPIPGATVVEFLPFVCRGTCDLTGTWLEERDVDNVRVRFPAPSTCFRSPCEGTYRAFWPVGETWSFYLVAIDNRGQSSIPSNIVTATRFPPGTTTTVTPTTTTLAATTTTLPPIPQPPRDFGVEFVP
jgi:hypothetical protein